MPAVWLRLLIVIIVTLLITKESSHAVLSLFYGGYLYEIIEICNQIAHSQKPVVRGLGPEVSTVLP